jgi:hypothetical protein
LRDPARKVIKKAPTLEIWLRQRNLELSSTGGTLQGACSASPSGWPPIVEQSRDEELTSATRRAYNPPARFWSPTFFPGSLRGSKWRRGEVRVGLLRETFKSRRGKTLESKT